MHHLWAFGHIFCLMMPCTTDIYEMLACCTVEFFPQADFLLLFIEFITRAILNLCINCIHVLIRIVSLYALTNNVAFLFFPCSTPLVKSNSELRSHFNTSADPISVSCVISSACYSHKEHSIKRALAHTPWLLLSRAALQPSSTPAPSF